ncbi:uncharacterized protein LOC106882830 isoform X2 [Octopus bimaculoides]|nr:uncharacterized protein LOC106882830 isoform X2 [Octopus bimaculoides]|eukprot:XP_014789103.1 PREDICTED: uncharacterized protein LOC106882830 isoform X2 [Octopus bimaculoides]
MKLDNKQPYLMADIHYVLGTNQKINQYNKHIDSHQNSDIKNSDQLIQPQKHCASSVRSICVQFLICLCVLLVLALLLTSSDGSHPSVSNSLKPAKSRNSTIYNSTIMILPTRKDDSTVTSIH